MLHVFDESLELTALDDRRLKGKLDTRWWIFLGPNGGFLSSLCLKALQHVVGNDVQPRTLTTTFLGRAGEGNVDLEVQLDKRGRTFSFASGRMYQNSKILTTFTGSFSPAQPGSSFIDEPMPKAKIPEELEAVSTDDAGLEFVKNFEYRLVLGTPYSSGARARTAAWVRFRHARPIDALQMPTIADALPPAVFVKFEGPVPTPTIELTVHFRSTLPRDYDWLLASFETRYSIEGFIEEDGEIWARDGTLIAQSRQLALLPTIGS